MECNSTVDSVQSSWVSGFGGSFSAETWTQVSHLQEFTALCSKGTCSLQKEALIRAGKCFSPDPDAPSPHHLITNHVPAAEKWQKGPTPHSPSTNPWGFPTALRPLPFNLSGPVSCSAQRMRQHCQPAGSSLVSKSMQRFCLLSGNPATTRTSRPGQPAGRVRGPQGEGSVQHPGGRPPVKQPAMCTWVSKSSQGHPGLMNQPSWANPQGWELSQWWLF